MTIVFVHGAGRGGKDAWPAQQGLIDETAATWLDWPDASGGDMSAPRDLMTDQVETLLAHFDEPIDVVAHSHGAVAALLAAQRTEALVQNLVLFEPACFSLARGQVAVEAHIDVMDPVLSRAADPQLNDLQYAALFFTALGASVSPTDTPEQQLAARRLRTVRAPWTVTLDPAVLVQIPTLVVTGDWLPLYEQTAEALVQQGAHHQVLAGHGHRPQDHPRASDLIRAFHAGSLNG